MSSYNLCVMCGHLTRDPQLSYTPNQTAVVDFGLATNRKWTGQDGAKREEVCFVDCRAFGRSAENINKYMKKGKALLIQGHLVLEQWTAPDGAKKSKLRIVVDAAQFMPTGQQSPDREPGDEIPF